MNKEPHGEGLNGGACCILGICCPPGSQRQIEALAKFYVKEVAVKDLKEGIESATCTLKYFDLAPKGTISALIAYVTQKAKEHA